MYEFRHMLYPILKQRFGKGDTFMQNYFSLKVRAGHFGHFCPDFHIKFHLIPAQRKQNF